VLVWEWRNYENTAYDPDKDTGYRIDGKPAMKFVQEFFGASAKSVSKNSGTTTAPAS
jgi:hypothetical protein